MNTNDMDNHGNNMNRRRSTRRKKAEEASIEWYEQDNDGIRLPDPVRRDSLIQDKRPMDYDDHMMQLAMEESRKEFQLQRDKLAEQARILETSSDIIRGACAKISWWSRFPKNEEERSSWERIKICMDTLQEEPSSFLPINVMQGALDEIQYNLQEWCNQECMTSLCTLLVDLIRIQSP